MDEFHVQEDLAFIKKIIEDTNQTFIHDGKTFIVWGLLVIIGELTTYYAEIKNIEKYIWYMWSILALIGWIFSFLDSSKRHQKVKANTIIGKAINAVWVSTGIAIMILVFLAPYYQVYSGVFINPIVCTLLGIAYFTTGTLTYKWMRYTAAGWWCGAIVMFIWPGLYTLLLMPVLLLLLQVIPGFIIQSQWKKSALS